MADLPALIVLCAGSCAAVVGNGTVAALVTGACDETCAVSGKGCAVWTA